MEGVQKPTVATRCLNHRYSRPLSQFPELIRLSKLRSVLDRLFQ